MHVRLFKQTVFLGERLEPGGDNLFHDVGGFARILFFENGSFTGQHFFRHRVDVESNRIGRGNMHGQQAAKACDFILAAGAFKCHENANLAHAGSGLVVNVRCHDTVGD